MKKIFHSRRFAAGLSKYSVKSNYGYKAHVSVDAKDGFILGGHITPAGTSDTTFFERVIDELDLPEGSYVFADKGYPYPEKPLRMVSLIRQQGIDLLILLNAS